MNTLNKISFKKILLLIMISLAMNNICWANSVKVLANPEPTHIEKKPVKLIKFKEIKADIDDEHFLAQPISLVAGNNGVFYVFDRLVRKVFMFDKEGKFIKTFGSSGQGPGEYGQRFDNNWLYFGPDVFLYLSSTANRKIIKYSPEGAFISEEKLPSQEYSFGPFFPVKTPSGDQLLLNGPKGTIDAFQYTGTKLEKKYSILSQDDFNWSIILEVREKDLYHWRFPTISDTYYDCIADGQTIIYLSKTSTVQIFKNDRLQKKFNIWPQNALAAYRKKLESRRQKLREQDIFIVEMFNNFVLDKDTDRHFYLSSIKLENNQGFGTYKFSIDGTLEKVLASPERVLLRAKKNNIYYGVGEGNILLFKEESAK